MFNLRHREPLSLFYHSRHLNDTRPPSIGMPVCDAPDMPPHHFTSTRPGQTTCHRCLDRARDMSRPHAVRKPRALGHQAEASGFEGRRLA